MRRRAERSEQRDVFVEPRFSVKANGAPIAATVKSKPFAEAHESPDDNPVKGVPTGFRDMDLKLSGLQEAPVHLAIWCDTATTKGGGLGVGTMVKDDTLAAGVAEVSVDRGSGQIKVHEFWCTIDCGVAVQPDDVIAQTESSIVYGLGMTLSERISIKNGAVEQSNFYDYRVPRMNEVPAMHIEVISTDNHPTGVGQMATPLVAPAISSAVMQLAGVRLRLLEAVPGFAGGDRTSLVQESRAKIPFSGQMRSQNLHRHTPLDRAHVVGRAHRFDHDHQLRLVRGGADQHP